MRIAILTQDQPLYLPEAFRGTLALLARDHDVVLVGLMGSGSGRGPRQPRFARARHMLRVFGPGFFLWSGLRYAWAKLATALGSSRYSIAATCQRMGVPWEPVADVNAPAWLDRLRSLEVDVAVSMGSNQIYRADLLAVPRLGIINVHGSPLPKLRGHLPSFWTLYHGYEEGRVCAFLVDEGMDSGPILVSRPVPIPPSRSLHEFLKRSKAAVPEVLAEAVALMAQDSPPLKSNDDSEATYSPFPTAEDVREFRRRGNRLM